MNKTTIVAAGLLLGSSLTVGCAVHATAAVDAPPPPQVTVQGQADVNVQVDATPAPETTDQPEELVATSEPPELVYEEQTDAPGPGTVWVGGYWQWSGNDWAWYYGGWYPPPEGRVYVDPYYEHVDDHVVYVHGYWGAHDAEPRYYGGDRIVFDAAVRPAGYVRGQHTFVARSTGLPPGHRGHYGPKPTGMVKRRPLPTATTPRTPVREAQHAEGSHAESAHATTSDHPEAKPEARPEAKPEPKPEPRPEPKPAPKPAPKKPNRR